MSTHLRIGAGACVLSTGLLISSAGGAIASAAPDSSAGQGQNVTSSNHDGTSTGNPVADLAKAVGSTIEKSLEGVSGTLNTLAKPGRRAATDSPTTPPTMSFSGTPTVYGSSSADDEPVGGTPAADPTTPVVDTVTTGAEQLADPPVGTPEPTPPVTSEVAPLVASPPPAPPTSWFGPTVDPITTVVNTVSSVPAAVMTFPMSVIPPITDIVTTVQGLLTSVATAGSTTLAALPNDLAVLLGTPVSTAPAIGGAAGYRSGTSPATGVPMPTPTYSVPSLSQLLMPVDPGAVVAAAGATTAAPTTNVAISGVSHGTSTTGTPLLAGGDSGGTLSTVERVIGAFVASVSITALAAMALPGLCALLATCAAGIRIGYRQAKAGATLPAVIARFAGSGPLGVVRSGSQVELHARAEDPQPTSTPSPSEAPRRRALWVVRDEPTPSQRLLEEAV